MGEAEMIQQDEETAILEAICEAYVEPVRQGRQLQFRCRICETMLVTQDAAVTHIEEQHEDEVKAFSEELRQESFATDASGFLGQDLQELFMAAAAMEEPPKLNR